MAFFMGGFKRLKSPYSGCTDAMQFVAEIAKKRTGA